MKKFIITVMISVTSLLTFSQDSKNFEIVSRKVIANKTSTSNVRRLIDSSYVVWYNDNDTRPGYYSEILKIDKSGNLKWNKIIDTSYIYTIADVKQTNENGFIICGSAINQKMPKVRMPHSPDPSNYDYWIEKLDSTGNIVWQKTYGGDQVDQATCVEQTKDGGYILVGYTESFNKDVKGNHGNYDYWVLKLKADGSIDWKKAYGSPEVFVSGKSYAFPTASYSAGSDQAYYVGCTKDGGYLVAGNSEAYVFNNNPRYNSDVEYNNGGTDIWVIKLSNDGKIMWQTSLAGKAEDFFVSALLVKDANLFITVNTKYDDKMLANPNGDHYYLGIVNIDKGEARVARIFDRDNGLGVVKSINLDTDSTLFIEGYYQKLDAIQDTTVIVRMNINGTKIDEKQYTDYQASFKNNDSSIISIEPQKDSGENNIVFMQFKPKPTIKIQDKPLNKNDVKSKTKQPIKKSANSATKPKKPM